MKTQSTTTEKSPRGQHSRSLYTRDSTISDSDDGSASLDSSTASFDYDLGECVMPLKRGDDNDEEEHQPRPTRMPRRNSLQESIKSLTEQISSMEGEKLPLSPPPKKKNSVYSPYSSPGALGGGMRANSVRSLKIQRSPGPLGGSLHGGRPRTRCSSPGPLGGSLHGKPRTRSPPPGPRGGAEDNSRTRSRSPLFTRTGNLSGLIRPRSKSPGPLGGSSHGSRRSLVGSGSRGRSKSPGTLMGLAGRGSFRLHRRQSKKNVAAALVSILRRGKFSSSTSPAKDTVKSPAARILPASSSSSPCESPTGHSGRLSLSSRSLSSRRSFSLPRMKQVRFWFQDEASITDTYATEESMQFGDLGLNDSGQLCYDDPEYDDYGQRTILKGELPFIEVMDFDGSGEYGELGLNDNDDGDSLVNKFNASTIQEESWRASVADGFASLSSLISEDEQLGSIRETNKEGSPGACSEDFRASNGMDDSSNHASQLEDSGRYSSKDQVEGDESLSPSPKRRTRQLTPPLAPFGDSSFTSLLSDDSNSAAGTSDISPSARETPRIGNFKKLTPSICKIADPSLDLSSWKKQPESSSSLSSSSEKEHSANNKEASVASETSSESPTGVTECQPDDNDEDAEVDTDEDDENNTGARSSSLQTRRSAFVSALVPSVGC